MRGKLKKPLLLILIVQLALLSCAFSGTYARYTTTITGSGSARVAKFDVQMLSDDTTAAMNFNTTGDKAQQEVHTYGFSVVSTSEVAVEYTVRLTFNNPPPANVSLWIDNGAVTYCNGTDTVFTFTGFDYSIGDTAKEHTLNVAVDYVANDKLIDITAFADTVSVAIIAEQKMPTQ